MDNQAAVLWQTILAEIQVMSDVVSEFSFKTWFEPAELTEIDGDKIIIAHPNAFARTQFEKKYQRMIQEILSKNGFENPEISYILKKKPRKGQKLNTESEDENRIKTSAPAPQRNSSISSQSNLNKQFTLDTFIVGNCNDMAYSAAQAIAENPGTRYNPLFIYGGSGFGKTHLIQAVGNKIEDNLGLKVRYLTAEDFTSDFLDHIRNKKTGFEHRYRNVDVLIVDDIQFIAGKTSTQEAFFHTFNSLQQKGKHVILSSDRMPSKIPTLMDRLVSRFQQGMVIDIKLPDTETRTAIIESKASKLGIELDHETAEYVAKNINTNIREIEGFVNKLVSYSEMKNINPSLEVVKELLSGMQPSSTVHFTAKQIVAKTASFFNVKPDDITVPPPSHQFAYERHIAMYLIRTELKYSWKNTASAVGRKDHTTAISGVRKIKKDIKLNNTLNEHVSSIRELLYV